MSTADMQKTSCAEEKTTANTKCSDSTVWLVTDVTLVPSTLIGKIVLLKKKVIPAKTMKVEKYNIKQFLKDDKYTRYLVPGLNRIYHKYGNGELTAIDGAVALLKNPDYPGYCMLMYCYCEVENGNEFNIRFTPAYTRNGERVLIKYPHDCTFCVFTKYYHDCFDKNDDHIMRDLDGELCFINDGVHSEM
jgi:hypothetical protein